MAQELVVFGLAALNADNCATWMAVPPVSRRFEQHGA
jgi:hypothetical protein